MIKAALIDDEDKGIKTLRNLLKDYCPDVEVIGTANSVSEGVELLSKISPDIVFLDIEMEDGDGFDILERISKHDFEVVFTTAYEEYAIRAFDFSALHYLLKPINLLELQKVVEIFKEKKGDNTTALHTQLQILQSTLNQQVKKIALPCFEGISFVNIDEIIRCEADKNYTVFYLQDGSEIIVSKNLGFYEEMLERYQFSRIHHKHLVNLKYVSKYVKGKGGYVVLNDDSHLEVSSRRKDIFLKKIKNLLDAS